MPCWRHLRRGCRDSRASGILISGSEGGCCGADLCLWISSDRRPSYPGRVGLDPGVAVREARRRSVVEQELRSGEIRPAAHSKSSKCSRTSVLLAAIDPQEVAQPRSRGLLSLPNGSPRSTASTRSAFCRSPLSSSVSPHVAPRARMAVSRAANAFVIQVISAKQLSARAGVGHRRSRMRELRRMRPHAQTHRGVLQRSIRLNAPAPGESGTAPCVDPVRARWEIDRCPGASMSSAPRICIRDLGAADLDCEFGHRESPSMRSSAAPTMVTESMRKCR